VQKFWCARKISSGKYYGFLFVCRFASLLGSD
jgi:hypothetical protein